MLPVPEYIIIDANKEIGDSSTLAQRPNGPELLQLQ